MDATYDLIKIKTRFGIRWYVLIRAEVSRSAGIRMTSPSLLGNKPPGLTSTTYPMGGFVLWPPSRSQKCSDLKNCFPSAILQLVGECPYLNNREAEGVPQKVTLPSLNAPWKWGGWNNLIVLNVFTALKIRIIMYKVYITIQFKECESHQWSSGN